ncbi:MAG: polysaccharide biosynthesis C-terminal domain-containing protein [Clostridia bacterium]|nr:polysaccharide biosynthesis C-terminal domain-containing protein [Clostridia bacterium]
MNFLTDDIRSLYRKMLIPSLTGAVVMSIYSFVDTIAVGQSEGAPGAAAMAVIAPVYGLMVFLGLLCGIGGSVMMSVARGKGNVEKGDACFTGSVMLVIILTGIAWSAMNIFRENIFYFFGANEEIIGKTTEYGQWIVWFMPIFVFTMFIASFIRNDGAPKLVMAAVVTGGCINMFGDWFLVFPMKLGMTGAALATVIGTSVQAIIMGSYFFQKRCHLRIAKPHHVLRGFRRVLQIGIGASLLDLGTIIIGIIMNRQILNYGSTTELAVFGVIATILSLFQALFCGVGQAIQPLVSSNYGAGQKERYQKIWKYSLGTVIVLGLFFCLLGECLPVAITKLFVSDAPEVFEAAPLAFRLFFPIFLFLGVVVDADYYLQSVMKEEQSVAIGLMHSVVLSGLFCVALPKVLGITGVWLAIPLADMLTALVGLIFAKKN